MQPLGSNALANAGLGTGDYVILTTNTLSQTALCYDIPVLESRGVYVLYTVVNLPPELAAIGNRSVDEGALLTIALSASPSFSASTRFSSSVKGRDLGRPLGLPDWPGWN